MKESGIIERIKEVSKDSSNPINILTSEVNPSKPEEKLLSVLSSSEEIKADISLAVLTIGDLIYDTLRLDPNVIKAIDFARTEDIGNIFKFSVYADRISDLPGTSYEGHIDNLKGYVGERFVAQELQSQGMEVEFPENPNQAGYDLLVTGNPAQVKCVADKSSVLEHFEKNPDIPVYVNEEVAQSLEGVPNVYPVNGFSLKTVEASTRETIESGDEVLDFEVPLIALSVAIGKNAYSLLNGKTDLKHGSINIAYDVAGGMAGGELGAYSIGYLGALLGPYGIVVGGLVGAVAGGIYGRRLISKVKKIAHTHKEEELTEKALKEFITESYKASKKSQEIFEKKVKTLSDNLDLKGKALEFLVYYSKRRINNERKYLKDKIHQLSIAKKNPRGLDAQSDDIVIAAINGVTLSLRAKVPPYSVKTSMENLVQSLESINKKRRFLS